MASHNNTSDAASELFGGWRVLKADATEVLTKTFITDNPHGANERHKLVETEGNSYYVKAHAKHHINIDKMLEGGMFRDMIFIGKEGNIYYSYRKGNEFAKNISDEGLAARRTPGADQSHCRDGPGRLERKSIKGRGFHGLYQE